MVHRLHVMQCMQAAARAAARSGSSSCCHAFATPMAYKWSAVLSDRDLQHSLQRGTIRPRQAWLPALPTLLEVSHWVDSSACMSLRGWEGLRLLSRYTTGPMVLASHCATSCKREMPLEAERSMNQYRYRYWYYRYTKFM